MPIIVAGTRYAYKNAEDTAPKYKPGTLLMEQSGGYAGGVWVVDYQNKLRFFNSGEQLEKLGFSWDQVIKVPESVLLAYDVKNATAITDLNPLILTGPSTVVKSNITKYLFWGAGILAVVLIAWKLKKGKK